MPELYIIDREIVEERTGHMSNTALNKDKDPSGQTKISRRQFVRAGVAAGVSGAALGTSLLSKSKENILVKRVQSALVTERAHFPVKITDKCRRMEQKYTIFARELWDRELIDKITSSVDRERMQEQQKAEGWTQLERALNEAGWAVDHKFATGSENGQPHSMAYMWDYPVSRRSYPFQDPEDASQKVKKAARFLGASLVGVTDYDPLWTYAQLIQARLEDHDSGERGPRYEIFRPEFPFEPKSVVVIAVEMDYRAMSCSPSRIEGAATGLGYSRMAEVGYSVATFIRELGYRAFANGNDVSLSIPYAIAAGLGELGRHGLLITPEYGPRVRLVKVFTELELKPDKPKTFGVWEFCRSCKRCAEACPSEAVSFEEPTLEGLTVSNNPGVLKWYIDPEKCIQFWTQNGSDCSNCIAACPYNKLPTWPHQLLASAASLPVGPVHEFMAKMDKVCGFGNTFDSRANASFWESD